MSRCQVLQSPIDAALENVEKIVLACIALHNYLCQTDSASYISSGFIDSENSTGTIKKCLLREEANNGTFKIFESLGQESIRVLLIQERLW